MRELRPLLQAEIHRLCRELLPRGRREGRLWVAYNPVTNDDKKEWALKIALTGDVGAWKDWRSGDRGDVLNLVAYLKGYDGGRAGRDTLAWAKGFLGLADMSDEQRQAVQLRARAEGEKAAKAADRRAAYLRQRAAEIFDAGQIISKASPPAVYMRGRGCPLEAVPNASRRSLRFHPGLEYWRGAAFDEDRETGRRVKVQAGPVFPAMVAALRDRHGLLTGVHCTFLTADGSGKAPVEKPKLMLGGALGSVIRICDGPSGKSCDDSSAEAAPLILCEGIEDGVTLAIAAGDVARAWAGGSLAGMGAAPVGLACISYVALAADNDWQSPQAMAQLEKVIASLEGAGKRVEPMRSLVGKDFNDWAQEEA